MGSRWPPDEELLRHLRKNTARCEWCGEKFGRLRQPTVHHIECKGLGGGARLDKILNLMVVCWIPCHHYIQTGGTEAKKRCLETVALREGLEGPEQVQEALWRLLRT